MAAADDHIREPAQGYVTDIDYTWGFYPEFSPTHLRWVVGSAGIPPVASGAPFTFVELGCGLGASTAMYAACHPEGRFFGIDLLERHVAAASAFAAAGPLRNCEFIAGSVVDLDPDVVPAADFIVAHGVYSWVNAEVRDAILRFIDLKLKPGGILFLSYNAMPGQALHEPVRRWMWEVARQTVGSTQVKVRAAVGSVVSLADQNPRAFGHGDRVARLLRRLRDADVSYLAHEYFNEAWTSFYFPEVVQSLAPLGLSYVGDARLTRNLPELHVSPAQAAALRCEPDRVKRRFLMDYLVDEPFHRDVWVRASVPAANDAPATALRAMRVAAVRDYSRIKREVQVPAGTIGFNRPLDDHLLQRIAAEAPTVGELLDDPAISGRGMQRALRRIQWLVASGVVCAAADRPISTFGAENRLSSAFHREILRRHLEGSALRVLPSTALGTGILLSAREALLVWALDAAGEQGAVDAAWEHLRASGRRLVVGGAEIFGEAAHRELLRLELGRFRDEKQPRFASLGLLRRSDG